MNRRLGVVVAVVVLVLMTSLVRCAGHRAQMPKAPPTAAPLTTAGRPAAPSPPPADPRSLARGSIRGTVRDEAGAAIAGAKVCGDASSWQLSDAETDAPVCAASDAHGAYRLGNLIAANYAVHAAARRFLPAVFYASRQTGEFRFPLGAGEDRAGIDLTLHRGGVEITGTVVDLAGGPVAHAQVRASIDSSIPTGDDPPEDCDDHGRFSLWVAPGAIAVGASADGYAPGTIRGRAPGSFEIVLTPTSSLAGTVIDAGTLQPVPGARVVVTAPDARIAPTLVALTDERGKFLVESLTPARYTAVATTARGYGRSDASALVGLAQHVDGVVVKLYPANRVFGRVELAGSHEPAPSCSGTLIDPIQNRRSRLHAEQDRLVADGVIPATYRVYLWCPGYRTHDEYDPVVVRDRDVEVTWQVDGGATVRGKVLTRAGAAVGGAFVVAMPISGGVPSRSSHSFTRSLPDGSYTFTALLASQYRLMVPSGGREPPGGGDILDVPASGIVEHDLVTDAAGAGPGTVSDTAGTLRGTVVDTAGSRVPGVAIIVLPSALSTHMAPLEATSDARGSFAIDSIPGGDYRVFAGVDMMQATRARFATADAVRSERASISAGQTTQVRLVVESPAAQITGVVIDAGGAPVADAFIASARESGTGESPSSNVERTRDWWGEDRPVLTATDGSFTLARLAPGTYTVRAYRKGGGEVIAEHVAVASRITLQIKATGSIDGIASAAGGPPNLLTLSLQDPATGLSRTESFYRSGGHFLVNDLPAGHFEITARGDRSEKTVTVDLTAGEARTGIAIPLDALVDVTGRLVDRATQKPIAGMRVAQMAVHGNGDMESRGDASQTDDAGRFTLRGVPIGPITLDVTPQDLQRSAYRMSYIQRTISAPGSAPGTGTVDLGDIAFPDAASAPATATPHGSVRSFSASAGASPRRPHASLRSRTNSRAAVSIRDRL